ncbi:type II site-specific deoxyribonuclease [Stakelama tenebrarum]|uniref:Type II site-specific deoxyribonuclease n=1 Tax=Stakelama tenebrarum TaxID=2711215 RepID=A0A6G6Y660_9SPHN|nr:type II site-specific deoxyribonuclease [Sphingosinithalassobacter tenebrarum]QIG80389.1 type II site-specific deoxyribonuclease [Sphingosinithalassobacter tenebrarum]
MLTDIAKSFQAAKRRYDRGQYALAHCFEVSFECLEALQTNANLRTFGNFTLAGYSLPYSVADSGERLSRPFHPELFIADPEVFKAASEEVADQLGNCNDVDPNLLDQVIYTAISAFSLSYDLWKPRSRKTPSTFFEVVIGSASHIIFPHYALTKHIPIKDVGAAEPVDALAKTEVGDAGDDATEFSGDSVSTDLVITNPQTEKGAVVPLKITTRERIVQPFAHQRILDSAYPGQYASFVSCISEVQRDDATTAVKQICVPGTVALFQKHLAHIKGLYYCDIPRRYARYDFTRIIPVKPFHALFTDIADHLKAD